MAEHVCFLCLNFKIFEGVINKKKTALKGECREGLQLLPEHLAVPACNGRGCEH